MHINDLPEIILVKFFSCYYDIVSKELALGDHSTQCELGLKLLAVCRVWRKLALPIVHRESFIYCHHVSRDIRYIGSCSDRDRDRDRGRGRIENVDIDIGIDDSESEPESEPEYSNQSNNKDVPFRIDIVKSSLDILDVTDRKIWPRALHIYAETTDDPIVVFRDIIKKIHTNKQALERVETVSVDIEIARIGMDNSTIISETDELGKEFCQIIPSVTCLHLPPTYWVHETYSFCKSLVSGYANKLKSITCPSWALEKVDSFSPELSTFITWCPIGGDRIPKIHADRLKVLSLNNIGNGHVLKSFESIDDSRMLSFSNLHTLELRASFQYRLSDEGRGEHLYPAFESDYRIFAPRLEKITINVCPYMLSMLSSIQGQTLIKCVEFFLDGVVMYITGLNLDKARGLFSRYAKQSNHEQEVVDMVAYINDISGVDGLAERIKLVYSFFIDGTPDIDRIDWKYLDDLDIHFPLHITDLRSFISKIPNLKNIAVRRLELASEDGSNAELVDPEAIVEPIESKIKHMSVTIDWDTPTNNTDIVTRYLNKLLPESKVDVEFTYF